MALLLQNPQVVEILKSLITDDFDTFSEKYPNIAKIFSNTDLLNYLTSALNLPSDFTFDDIAALIASSDDLEDLIDKVSDLYGFSLAEINPDIFEDFEDISVFNALVRLWSIQFSLSLGEEFPNLNEALSNLKQLRNLASLWSFSFDLSFAEN